jgi:GAF domain-containing protein
MTTPLESGPLSALYDVVEFAAQLRELEEDKAWARVCEKLCVALEAEAATYYVFLPQKLQIAPRFAMGIAADDLKGTPVDIRTGLSGWVALHKEPLLVEDAYKDDRFLREVDKVTGFKTKSVLGIPLFDRLELTGVLQLLNKKEGGVFTRDDLDLAVAATRVVATALRAAKLESTVDKVTARNASILENLGGGFLAIDLHAKVIL